VDVEIGREVKKIGIGSYQKRSLEVKEKGKVEGKVWCSWWWWAGRRVDRRTVVWLEYDPYWKYIWSSVHCCCHCYCYLQYNHYSTHYCQKEEEKKLNIIFYDILWYSTYNMFEFNLLILMLVLVILDYVVVAVGCMDRWYCIIGWWN